MKKETGIAVFLGILAGVAIAVFVIIGAQQSRSSGDVMQGTITPTVTSVSESMSPLVISQPQNETLTSSDSIKVSGTTQKNALIVIQSPAGESVFTAKSTSFESTIELAPGENAIKVTSYTPKNVTSKSFVIYSISDAS